MARSIAACLESLARADAMTGQPAQSVRATRLAGAAEALRKAIGAPLTAHERTEFDKALAMARAQLGAKAYASAWEAGRGMQQDRAIAAALEPV